MYISWPYGHWAAAIMIQPQYLLFICTPKYVSMHNNKISLTSNTRKQVRKISHSKINCEKILGKFIAFSIYHWHSLNTDHITFIWSNNSNNTNGFGNKYFYLTPIWICCCINSANVMRTGNENSPIEFEWVNFGIGYLKGIGDQSILDGSSLILAMPHACIHVQWAGVTALLHSIPQCAHPYPYHKWFSIRNAIWKKKNKNIYMNCSTLFLRSLTILLPRRITSRKIKRKTIWARSSLQKQCSHSLFLLLLLLLFCCCWNVSLLIIKPFFNRFYYYWVFAAAGVYNNLINIHTNEKVGSRIVFYLFLFPSEHIILFPKGR